MFLGIKLIASGIMFPKIIAPWLPPITNKIILSFVNLNLNFFLKFKTFFLTGFLIKKYFSFVGELKFLSSPHPKIIFLAIGRNNLLTNPITIFCSCKIIGLKRILADSNVVKDV